MTAQDAFAIAFDDETWAMDAMPGMGLNMKTPKPAGSGLDKFPGMAKGMGDATPKMKTLAEHDEERHKGGYKGGPCTWREANGLGKMTLAEATAKGIANKKFPDVNEALANKGESKPPQDGSNLAPGNMSDGTTIGQSATPEMQEAEARQIAEQGPAAVVEKLENQTSADMFAQPKEIQTEEGTIRTENVGQLAAVIVNETATAQGNPLGSKANAQLVQAQEDGTITQGEPTSKGAEVAPEQQANSLADLIKDTKEFPLNPRNSGNRDFPVGTIVKRSDGQQYIRVEGTMSDIMDDSDRQQAKWQEYGVSGRPGRFAVQDHVIGGTSTPDKGGAQIVKTPEDGTAIQGEPTSKGAEVAPEQQAEQSTITSSDGSYNRPLTAEETAIIQANPDKKEVLQTMVDIEGKLQSATSAVDREQLKNGLKMWQEMFNGQKNPSQPLAEAANGVKEEVKTQPSEKLDDNTTLPKDGAESASPTSPTPPPVAPDGGSPLPPAPSDEEFRVGKNKYRIGDTTFTDVSGKGMLRTLMSAFFAGLRGEGVITGWDRINGTWDNMKRSETGEMVRDGITSALCQSTIGDYANREGLSENAKMEIEVIDEMMKKATTPAAKMKAVKEFQAWKEKYAKELGELENPVAGQTFKPLPNDYKGSKPPVSILKKSEGFEADKEFGDKVAAGLQERLGILGFQIEGLEGVSVGPSATTVKFKVPPTFDITAANSKKTRESLKGAIGGTEVSSVEYAKGATDVIAITVTNPKMRNVAFSDVLNSQSWKTFAKKAALPIPLGRDSSGEETMLDAATMPQTIVTGATGSGKSVFISAAINGIEMEKTPDEARIVLLDPKNEFKVQDGSPHLLFPRAGGDPDKAKASKDMADVLDSLVAIMNERVTKIGGVIEGFDPNKNEFKGAAEHSIKQYNEAHPDDRMPHILLVFDEIANARDNATAADKARIDLALQKLTAIGRSVGVNCLLATQRDDVGSIPGIIQANCPGRVTFKASPTDAKASQEAKSLAGNGDYILTDKAGNKTRGRGCFISPEEEMAIPSYYRNHMKGGDSPAEPTLPKEYTDGIAQAAKNKQPVSVQAIEGMEEAFKKALPEGWTIEKEKVDGEDYWKAAPPKPTRVDVPGDKKSDTAEDWTNAGSREEAVDSLNKRLQKAKAAAWEEFKNSKKTNADRQKYAKAVEKANSELQADMEIVNSQFPEQIADGDSLEPSGQDSGGEMGEPEGNEEDEELALFPKGEVQVENATKSLKKQISKWQAAMRDGEMTSEEVKKMHAEALKRIKDAKKAMQDGIDGKPATREQIDAILNPPKAKPAGTAATEQQSAVPEEEQSSEEEKAAQEEEKKNEQRRNSVQPQKGYSERTIAGSYEATERLTPKDQKNIQERYLPDGWEFVTENGFNAPAKNKFGVVFVRDPKTGSQGRLIPDQKNPKGFKFQKDVDTTHPEYKGFVKKADGTWELSPEAKKVEEETRNDRKQTQDPQKRDEARKRLNRAKFGHDEAPDNKTIVANAVMEALKIVEG